MLCDTTTACRRLLEATAYHLDVFDGIYLEGLGLRHCGGRPLRIDGASVSTPYGGFASPNLGLL